MKYEITVHAETHEELAKIRYELVKKGWQEKGYVFVIPSEFQLFIHMIKPQKGQMEFEF